MSNVGKLVEKMKRQPHGIRPEEAEKVLIAYGYLPVRQKGSHRHYLNQTTGGRDDGQTGKPTEKPYVIDILHRIGED